MIQKNILLITIAAVTLQIFCSRTLAESFDSESRSQADVSHAVPSQVPECQKKESEFRVPPWARNLNLTPEQRSRLQAIHEKSRTMDEPLYQKERETEKKCFHFYKVVLRSPKFVNSVKSYNPCINSWMTIDLNH